MDPLELYINDHCQQSPAACQSVNAFVAAFKASLDPDLRPAWKRSRVVARLTALGYQVGTIDNVFHVAGVASGSWQNHGGRLVLSA